MGYILQYFDDLIPQTSIYHYKPSKTAHGDHDLCKEIRIESFKIQERLREIYYSEIEDRSTTHFFHKINRRLESLLDHLEPEILAYKRNLIVQYDSWSATSYNNFHCLRNEMIGILAILKFEFEVLGIEIEKRDSVDAHKWLNEKTIYDDHQYLVDCVVHNREISPDFIEKYDIGYIVPDLTPDYFEYSILHELKQDLGIQSVAKYTLEELQEDYEVRYILAARKDKSIAYSLIADVIEENTTELTDDEKLEYIIDFFLHTGLCGDLVLKYFQKELLIIQDDENNDVCKYIDAVNKRLNNLKNSPKFRRYHVSKIEGSFKDTYKLIADLLAYYKKMYITETKMDEEIKFVDKLIWNGHPKEFIAPISKLIESKKLTINGNTDRDKLVHAISEIFEVCKVKENKNGKREPLSPSSLKSYFKKEAVGENY